VEAVFVFAVAYVLTGVRCILRDRRRPFGDRPAYARRGILQGRDRGYVTALFGWLPLTIILALYHRQWGAAMSMWLFLAILVVGGVAML
jgi:hypothetical protein